MIEFGCGLERSCAFVRRMAIRNQLPLSQRTILLQHLVERKIDSETERVALLDSFGIPLEPDGVPEGETFQQKDTSMDATDKAANSNDNAQTTAPEEDVATPRISEASAKLPEQLKSHLGN